MVGTPIRINGWQKVFLVHPHPLATPPPEISIRHHYPEDLYRRALSLLPGGVNSPVRAMRAIGRDPIFIESGGGALIRDVDGTPVDARDAKKIIAERYTVPPNIRALRRQPRAAQRIKRRPTDGIRSTALQPSPPVDGARTNDATFVAKGA